VSSDAERPGRHAPLWSKGKAFDAEMLRYTARDDYALDRQLLPFDLQASIAHVRGLARIGGLDGAEADRLIGELEALIVLAEEGRFTVQPEHEDGHTAIEAALVERLGETGKRVHLGRSRNDQVLVAVRLFEKHALTELARLAVAAADAMARLATEHETTLMPGYTHLQRAMPQSFAHWALAFAEGFADSAFVLGSARDACDKSPLGAAAGYGVNLPLDREGVAKGLDFAALDVNPLWSQTSRGLTEVVVLAAAWHAMATVRRLAWDLSLFTTTEFGFVSLPDDFTTGSSIMPQKRNPDVVELMRGACSVVQGALNEIMSLSALPSGYHRDLQLTKAPLLRALEETRATLTLVPALVSRLELDVTRMAAAVSPEMLATDKAVDLAKSGVPFRDAYKAVGTEVLRAMAERPLPAPPPAADVAAGKQSLADRTSTGASGALRVDLVEARIAAARAQIGAQVNGARR
jgi:argininosuccinate lyase